MTPNDYQQAALRTAPGDLPPERLLLNGLMGLNGEAGEAIDILKKHLFQGHELDTAHMKKPFRIERGISGRCLAPSVQTCRRAMTSVPLHFYFHCQTVPLALRRETTSPLQL